MKPSEEHGAALYVNSEYLDVEARDTGRVGQQHGMYENVRDAGGGGQHMGCTKMWMLGRTAVLHRRK